MSDKVTIRTNYQWRDFAYSYEVPDQVLSDQFDYMDDPSEGTFFCYRGIWYSLDTFIRLPKDHSFGGAWNGAAGDSFFSGVLIELSEDGEQYRVATYYS